MMMGIWAAAFALFLCRFSAALALTPLPMLEIAPGVFVHQGAYQLFTPQNEGGIGNLGFVIGRSAVAVIDTGGSDIQGQRLKAAIAERTPLPVRYVVNTHMHPDHIFGNSAFQTPGVEFVGHAKLARALEARAARYISANAPLLGEKAGAGLSIIAPTLHVHGELDLDLGGRILRLTAHPTAHTDNDLTAADLETGTLFAGDLLFSRHLPALDGSLKGWLAVMENLKGKPFNRVVPGHGPPSLPWPEALQPQQRYLRRLMADVLDGVKKGRPLAETARIAGLDERGAWELFDEFNARNAAAAYAELEWEE